MAILVTGGAGFIGSHFIERLLKETDQRIVCFDNFNAYYDPQLKYANVAAFIANERVTVIEADFCSPEAVERVFTSQSIESIQSVVHLGAYAGVHASVQNPRDYLESNVLGTLNLLEASRRYPVDRFLLISSSTVYGTGAAIPFREDAPLGIPASPYGASKRSAELLGLTYHQLHEVPVVCLRPFSVYGPRLRPDLAMSIFTGRILRGEALPLYGDGSVRRDFTHVSDICGGLLAALSADGVVGQLLNLGHSEPIEIRELIAMLENALGQIANVQQLPARGEDLPITFADLSKSRQLLGYEPQVTFADGVPEFCEWYKRWHRRGGK